MFIMISNFSMPIIIVNLLTNSSAIDAGKNNDNLPEWVAAFTAIAAVTITSLIFFRYMKKHEKESIDLQKKQNRFAALIELFKLLNDNAHRNARRRCINLYGVNEELKQWNILEFMNATKDKKQIDHNYLHTIHLESREIVKADFDQIGSLVIEEIIYEKEFLNIYWYEVLKCWKAVFDDIQERREKENYNYMKNFEYLMNKAEVYRAERFKEITSPLNMDKSIFHDRFTDVKV